MVKYYMSGYWNDGDTIYHTEETCPGARQVRATRPEERTVQGEMELCDRCRRIGEGRLAGRRYYNQ